MYFVFVFNFFGIWDIIMRLVIVTSAHDFLAVGSQQNGL